MKTYAVATVIFVEADTAAEAKEQADRRCKQLPDFATTLIDLTPVETAPPIPPLTCRVGAMWSSQVQSIAWSAKHKAHLIEKMEKANADPLHGEKDILRYMRAGWELGSQTPVRSSRTLYSFQLRGIGKGGPSKRASGVAVLKLVRQGRLKVVHGRQYWRKVYRFSESKCAICGADTPTGGAGYVMWTCVTVRGVENCDHLVCQKCSGASSPAEAGTASRDPYDPDQP